MSYRSGGVIALMPWAMTLGVMRSLGRTGVPVYGLRHGRLSPSRASRYSAGTVAVGRQGRPIGDPEEILLDFLAEGRRLGEEPVLVPGLDEWALFIAEHSDTLRQAFRFQIAPVALVRQLTSKEGQCELATGHGVAIPPVMVPRDATHAAELAETLTYPVMVKPNIRRLESVDKEVAHDLDSLMRAYRALEEDPAAPNVTFQPYVPGRDDDDWIFTGYFDAKSRCMAGFTGHKIRQQPAHAGHCSFGVTRHEQTLIDTSVSFLTAIGYRGIVEVGYRFDRRDGSYWLLDVNPRLGGAFRLLVDSNGVDVVRAMYADLTGQGIPPIAPKDGRIWIKEHEDVVAFAQYRRSCGMRAGDWLGSLRRVNEATVLSWRDPAPTLVAMAVMADETLGGRLGRKD